MEDPGNPVWNLAEHLAAGSAAIMQIESHHGQTGPEPVCHHFCEVDPVDPAKVSVEAIYSPAVPLFVSAGVEFLPDRLEAWEKAKPGIDWLQRRLPLILAAAKSAGLIYLGWTWEPVDRQLIGATCIEVIDNRTVSHPR